MGESQTPKLEKILKWDEKYLKVRLSTFPHNVKERDKR